MSLCMSTCNPEICADAGKIDGIIPSLPVNSTAIDHKRKQSHFPRTGTFYKHFRWHITSWSHTVPRQRVPSSPVPIFILGFCSLFLRATRIFSSPCWLGCLLSAASFVGFHLAVFSAKCPDAFPCLLPNAGILGIWQKVSRRNQLSNHKMIT